MNAREQLEAVPPLNQPVCTDEAAHAAGLDIAPTPTELTAMAEAVVSSWGDRGHDPLNLAESVADAGAQLARAMPLVLAELDRLRATVADVREYAVSRCTDEHQNVASASWVLHLTEWRGGAGHGA
jgi:hypothetical protein